MYRPPAFRLDDLAAQHALIRAQPLGLLVTAGSGGLLADPVPFLLDPEDGPFGTLRAHLARANPQVQALAAAPEALVAFTAAQAYVTPSWYASKAEHGRVVPTWNYAVVQARGPARLVEDADWLLAHVAALTEAQEAGRPEPWAVSDAPAPFVAAQLRAIVGLEIPIARIEGKLKASQNRPAPDREGVAAGLSAAGAPAMARLVREGAPPG
jgi:transcriptional regulator